MVKPILNEKELEEVKKAVQADPANILAHRLLERVEEIERIQKR